MRWQALRDTSLGLGLLCLCGLGLRHGLPSLAFAREQSPAAPAASSPSRPAEAPQIASYTLNARLDTETRTIKGSGTLVWKNPSALPTRELYFHLYLNAFKNESSLFLRSPFGAGRSGARARDWGYIDVERLSVREMGPDSIWPGPGERHTPDDLGDETDVRVALPREVAGNETLTLDLEFKAKLPAIVERTGYSDDYYFVAQWFPKIAKREASGTWIDFPFHAQSEFYADFGDYDVTLDVPAGTVLGASGVRVGTKTSAKRLTERYVATGVHDFAWTAWSGFREAHERIAGVDVRLLYPPGHERNRDATLSSIRHALPYFEKQYGTYPYPSLTVVHPPRGAENTGGMEYPMLITTGGPWYMSYGGVRAIEAVTVHELGHQWFYGLLASDEHRYPFLDEGINTYAENDALRARFGSASSVNLDGLTLEGSGLSRAFAAARERDASIALGAADFPGFRSMAALVYSRTGTVLETLARVYGREAMRRALRAYCDRFRFHSPEPADFIAPVRENLGEDAARALSKALFERGTIDFIVREVQSIRESTPGGVFDREVGRETIGAGPSLDSRWVGRAVVVRAGAIELPVDVEFTDERGIRTRQHWDGHGEFHIFDWTGTARLEHVVVDPDSKILLDSDLLNNAGAERRAPPLRAFERALYFAELLLSGAPP